MRKKYFYVYLALLIFALSAAAPVYAEETEPAAEAQAVQPEFETEGTILTAYHGTNAEVSIPEGVTEIDSWCFFENQTVQKVVLPSTIRKVGYCAFYGSSLKEVILPEGLETIDDHAFYCDGLSRVLIPRSVKEIGEYVFPWNTFLECYAGTAGFAYAKENQSDNSVVLDAPKNFSDLQITLAQMEFVYDGYDIEPEVAVLDGSTVLKEETDYTVQYSEAVKPGVYTVTVQAAFSEVYTGSRTLTYTIRPRTVRHLVSGLGTSSGQAALQWNSSPEADSYEVVRYDSQTRNWVLVNQVSETSCTDTGLKADTAYQYRVRACVSADGQTLYSDYSNILSLRTLPTDASVKKTNNSVKKGAAAKITSVKTALGVSLDTSSLGWSNWSHVSDVTEFLDGKGCYCFAYRKGKDIYIKKYANSSKLKLKQTLKIKQKYPLLGGIVCDSDNNYYIVWGKNDEKGTGNVDTMAISKYNSKGKHLKTVKYYTEKDALKKSSWDTRYPFDAGNCAIALKGNLLICSYGREMYNGHQSNDVISVNIASMEKVTRFSNYVSHSFNQSLLISKDDEAIFTNHGDAYPRGIETAKEWLSDPAEREWQAAAEESPVVENNSFHFYGETGNNWTGAQLGGIAEVSSGYFLAAAGPKSMTEKAKNESQNVFVQLLSKSNLESVLEGKSRSGTSSGSKAEDKGILWLTNYSNKYTANAVSVTATDDDRVIVMWEKADSKGFVDSYYVILAANGRILQNAVSLGGRRLNLYEPPVYRSGYLYWTSVNSVTKKAETYRMKVNGVALPKSIGQTEGLTYEKYWKNWTNPVVLVKWERVGDAQGYEVYRSTSANGTYKKIKELKSAAGIELYDENVSRNTVYYYKVRAWRKSNGKKIVGKYSKPLKVKVDW